jgi:hypothetical protein
MMENSSQQAFISSSSHEPWDAFDGSQAVDASMTNDLGTPSASYPTLPNRTTRKVTGESPAAHRQSRSQPEKLQFLQLAEWDEHNSYDENDPSCLHYSIEWKVIVNNKVVSKDTEQDLVLVPTAYWHMVLKPKLERLLRKKIAQNRHVRCDDTSVVVSVTDRSKRDLIKRFDDIDIDWSIIEKQLLGWSELYRYGKKLRVDLSFNYVDFQLASAGTPKRGCKRGSSATQQMLAERAAQLDAEQEGNGHPSIWQAVYSLMQCPGQPCTLGPHCWRDPFGKKHYKLRTHHLKALINFVEQGNTLQSHDDVPEEQQLLDRQSKSTIVSTPFPPINITNVLPGSSHQSPMTISADSAEMSLAGLKTVHLDIPGPRDLAVRMYSEWQQSNVIDEGLKTEFQKARNVALDDGLDLEQVYQDQDPSFFIQSGVKRGVARRFVSDIEEWVKGYKLSYCTELSG